MKLEWKVDVIATIGMYVVILIKVFLMLFTMKVCRAFGSNTSKALLFCALLVCFPGVYQ
jgi:MFS-type transporter involved in bile tolerance (Atg22 family)